MYLKGNSILLLFCLCTMFSFGKFLITNKTISDAEVNRTISNLLDGYDCRLRPDYLGKPVEVIVEATILSIKSVDIIKMTYTMELFFRQRWRDYRLKHNLDQNLQITVGEKHPADIIWTPDTVFINSAVSNLFHLTVNNHHVDISPLGEVFWGTRVSVSPKCVVNLVLYPMDIRTCVIETVSYGYSTRHIQYKWSSHNPIIVQDKQMNQFVMTGFDTIAQDKVFISGNFTYLTASFTFQRLFGFAIIQIYVPTIAIVVISWMSLWVRRDVPPARVSLCITALLTICTVWSSVNSQLPRVNYFKAVDIYLMVSFCNVIFTLIEYTLVLNSDLLGDIWRQRKKLSILTKIKNKTLLEPKQSGSLTFRGEKKIKSEIQDTEKQKQELAKKISAENDRIADKIEHLARIIFPLTFIVFNIFYWTIFLLK
ncbi:gamma-aminobutyric acid receptor subunit beta-3 isoform X1 [Hydra vulgaris]|uniref:gamma-aminobutyric acid receptor subunit beta-3 isoform X1 n=2 Tax=Hydra vulgaris TaxID=6087 RepID=UPI0001926949|nr:gamma-aminobutyric acid receptor subunit beta-3 isoform X1 [Hydra vulgaris]